MLEATVHGGRRKRIALLLNSLSSDYQLGFKAAIERAATAAGMNVLVVVGREIEHVDANEQALNVAYEWLSDQGVDGVIALASTMSNYAGVRGITRLARQLAPLPVTSIGIAIEGVSSIVLDNRVAMRTAVEHLIVNHGLRRVAFIAGPSHNQEAIARLEGYRGALRDNGIEYDPALVEEGYFTIATGRQAMDAILRRRADVQGVVAANDYMALGALDGLQEQGLRVPEDVLVIGFDDSPVARFASRSLTSVAQPVESMAHCAVRSILGLMQGLEPEPVSTLGVNLTLRESCGCGYVVGRARESSQPFPGSSLTYVASNRTRLIHDLVHDAGPARAFWNVFAARLVDALVLELEGAHGTFLRAVERIADEAITHEVSLDDVGRVIVQLRRDCRREGLHGAEHSEFEEVVMKALAILASSATRREGRRALDMIERAYGLRHVNQQLSVSLDTATLCRNFAAALTRTGIPCAFLATTADGGELRALAAFQGERTFGFSGSYSARQLFPVGFPDDAEPWCLVLFPLTFEAEVLGLVAFDGATDPFSAEALRGQIAAALKLGALHHRVVEEASLRERLGREQLLAEMAIAKRIQTAIVPRHPQVPTLQIGAGMVAADEVGGDYYDVIPIAGGAWIGIGDVTGHGLLSGLIMLMVQSVVGALVKQSPNAAPAELVAAANAVLRPNIRERLGQSEHVTFMLLRYFEADGRLVFAGAHEDLLLWRASTGRCETLRSEGMWIGILEDVSALTADSEVLLHSGDVVVLVTDGLIEARNGNGEQFGVERLRELVERHATQPATALYEQLVAAATAWAAVQQDDITCVVLKRT